MNNKLFAIKFNVLQSRAILIIGLLLSCFLTTSCIGKMPKGWGAKPRMTYFRAGYNFMYEDNDYAKGFNSGCQTFLTITGGAFTLMLDAIDGWAITAKNPDGSGTPHPIIKNAKLYQTGFADGMEHCFYYLDWSSL